LAKDIITNEYLSNNLKKGQKTLSIKKGAILTHLALDLIKKENIKLIFEDELPENNSKNDLYHNKKEDFIATDLPNEIILKFYYLMLKIRLFEELAKAYKEKGIIPGDFVHLYLGEEAIAVGACSALGKEDYITSTHRGHGHLIAKGADISKMLAELLGKVDGYCRGKGGSMHITDIGLGILGANGIVGAGLPIACGSGLVSKLNNDNTVTVSFFGDGASNQGTFGESLNFAKIFSLPVLFLCENNGYAISTPLAYGCSNTEIYKKGLAFGIESQVINGDDVFEVYQVCKDHINEMRKNPHPVLIEAITHRHVGHWVGDPQNYRSHEELSNLPKYDPIKIFLDKIKSRPDISGSAMEETELKVINEIKEAAIFADNSSYPPVQEAIKNYLKE
jgi:acetoin:2,6-dichlorophenolindophenol oxidoreductase subunit alpha